MDITPTPAAVESPISFRDPGGRLWIENGRVFREVFPNSQATIRALLRSSLMREWVEAGRMVKSSVLIDEAPGSEKDGRQLVLEHETCWFPSYPYEWPAEMLAEAGRLTVELAMSLLPLGMGLKDATPYNVLFDGTNPVFIDVLSVESRAPGDDIWLAYGQFVRTFLLPLLMETQLGVWFAPLLRVQRDGLEPEQVARMAGWARGWNPTFFSLVRGPLWLEDWIGPGNGARRPVGGKDPETAQFVLQRLFAQLQRRLVRLEPAPSDSRWSEYSRERSHYAPSDLDTRRHCVQEVLRTTSASAVLDIGSNTGEFSLLCAGTGAKVVAIDRDSASISRLWRAAHRERLNVLPLVVDWSRPSPALGWNNREHTSFLSRARGKFDLVLMLAVLHHLLAEGIPLGAILDTAAEASTRDLLIEFVPPADPMFQSLLRGRNELHDSLTPALFESELGRRFLVLGCTPLEHSGRCLYHVRKHAAR